MENREEKTCAGERAARERKIALLTDGPTEKIIEVRESPLYDHDTLIEQEYGSAADETSAQNCDLYFENGSIVKKSRDANEFGGKSAAVERELEAIRAETRARLAEYMSGRSLCAAEALRTLAERRREAKRRREQLELTNAEGIRLRLLKSLEHNEFKYYCSICLIIRDENEYLKEWLEWHIAQGAEHFYIYDHGSKRPVSEFIQTLDEDIRSRVTVIYFGGPHVFAQHDAYNDCLNRYKTESRWIGFIDSDEMVRVRSGRKLAEYLKDYERYAGLFLVWIMYGANGRAEKSDGPVRERFSAVSPSDKSAGVGKVFVQPMLMKRMLTHNGYPAEGFIVVDEHGDRVEEAEAWKPGGTTDTICLDHYYTKSYAEWVEKMKRGSCDPQYFRKYAEFFDYNPDMEYCREEIYPVQEYEISKK